MINFDLHIYQKTEPLNMTTNAFEARVYGCTDFLNAEMSLEIGNLGCDEIKNIVYWVDEVMKSDNTEVYTEFYCMRYSFKVYPEETKVHDEGYRDDIHLIETKKLLQFLKEYLKINNYLSESTIEGSLTNTFSIVREKPESYLIDKKYAFHREYCIEVDFFNIKHVNFYVDSEIWKLDAKVFESMLYFNTGIFSRY